MITSEEFSVCATEANDLASHFMVNYLDEEIDLREEHRSTARPSSLYLSLLRFVGDWGEPNISVIPYDGLPDGFASWLYMADDQLFIALDLSKMRSWWEARGMAVETQRIRSIVHELGHYILTPECLERGKGGTAGKEGLIESVTPEEEEKAWLFAMTFLGVVLADYSKRRRQSDDEDDALLVPV